MQKKRKNKKRKTKQRKEMIHEGFTKHKEERE